MNNLEFADKSIIHYFVDEAGDPTLFSPKGKIIIETEGCSRFFILGKLDVENPDALTLEVESLRSQLLSDPYFKGVPSMQPEKLKTALAFHATDDPAEVRREVFKLLVRHNLRFYAVVRDKRELVSYDDDVHYVRLFRQFGYSDYHKIFMVEDWDKIPIERLWDVVLIDHRDSRRRIEAKRLANYAKYVILHDSNPESNPCFRYSEVYPRYKYRHDYTSVRNHVTVLSNFVDLSNL